jgi:hypothetical protein
MKILIVGTCSSRGPGSWPYFLETSLGCEVVNLSLSSVGGSYIHETVVNEIALRRDWYDLVLVVWVESFHESIKVDNIDYFEGSINTSKYQSEQNDWPEKIVEPFDDQSLVAKNWVLGIGARRGMRDKTIELFAPYNKFVKYPQILESDLIRMISTQEVLKANNMPYLFLFGRKLKQVKRFEHLYAMIDWKNFYTEDNLADIATRHPEWQTTETKYPTEPGQKYYADQLAQYIIDRQLGS